MLSSDRDFEDDVYKNILSVIDTKKAKRVALLAFCFYGYDNKLTG